jgi:FemAB-related protein (PEP-CTERM system-associated)
VCMIKLLDESNCSRWDEFVQQNTDATFFHQAGWKVVIEKAFGHKTYFFYVEKKGKITGILPLVHINSLLFGNTLVSLAPCVYGGVVASDNQSYIELNEKACHLANELGVNCLEIRNKAQKHPDRPYKELYVYFRKELDADIDKNFMAIPRKQRAMVRKGIEAGLTSVIDTNIDSIYKAYSESVRNLGTPVFSKKYFQILKDVFGHQCEVLSVLHNGQLIASVMSFYFKDEILPYYGGGTELSRILKGNDFMYWEVMRRAVEKGIKVFDFGRSKIGTGSYSFKKNWGFSPQQLYYEFYLVKSTSIPDVNTLNPKYKFFIAAWKRLPLSISQVIGPFLAKNLS